MAFQIQTFKTRSLTAVVFVVVMLAGLLFNKWAFFVLFSIINFGCWAEYLKLVGLIDKNYQQITFLHKDLVLLLGWSFMCWMTEERELYSLGMATVINPVFLLVLFGEVFFGKKKNTKPVAHSLFGLIYISLSWGLMISLRFMHISLPGREYVAWALPVILIASIWINDTMAYIVGSLIGKTPFSKISPKKTWEGVLGGAVLAVVVVTLVCKYGFGYEAIPIIIISSIAAIAGTAGDLFESKLKRLAGIKDSGNIMPGHGGFLDRFDSLLVATPFVWLYVKMIL